MLSPDQRRDFDEARRLGKRRLGAEDLVRTHHIEPCADASGPAGHEFRLLRGSGENTGSLAQLDPTTQGRRNGCALPEGDRFRYLLWSLAAFMNKSGLNSAEASAALSLFLLAVVSPFLLVNGIPQFSAVKWQMAVPACVFDALGLLALNSLLASASSVQAGSAFVIVTVVQVAIPAAYLAVLAGGLTLRSAIGLVPQ